MGLHEEISNLSPDPLRITVADLIQDSIQRLQVLAEVCHGNESAAIPEFQQ